CRWLMIKSNFNPNGRFSGMNPDQAVFVEVDKGNLTFFANKVTNFGTTATPNIGKDSSFQTLEWCFGSRGVYEITALGEIITDLPKSVLREYFPGIPGGPDDPNQRPLIRSQEKLVTVIQIFDQLTHST